MDRPTPLGELPIQYPDFARWQRRWLETRSLTYWKKQLDPLPPAIELPHDYERPDPMTFRGNSIFFNIPGELLANLQALSRRQNVTLYMTLLAAFKTLLHRYSGQTDIVIGGASANRTQFEMEKLIGFFVNMLVLRTDVSGDPKFTELLQRVREVTLGAYAHQHTPYAALVTELKVEREWNRNPLFQVLFVLQNAPLGEVEVRGLSVSPLLFKSDFSAFDLLISLSEKDNAIEGAVAYSEELFKRETIELLFDRYRNLLESIVANPEERLSQLELHGYVETADYSLPQFLTDLRPREMDKLLTKLEISGD
jgi:non-ribosomal peptide synthetase component F